VPFALTLAGPVLVIERSARGGIGGAARRERVPGVGSVVVVPMGALLVIDPPCAGAGTWIVIVPGPPVAELARVQVTEMFPLWVQDQPAAAVTELNVTPAGKVSVTLTLLASDGPLLATDSV